MDQEQSWVTMQTVGNDEHTAHQVYAYFMRPEPRDNMSEIRVEYDPLLKRKIKVRDVRIGMTRNASEENTKVVKAYLEPYPHMRIDKAKPLQGWYKSLHEPPNVRPRPCFTEAVLTEPYGGWCAVGCAFSLPAGEQINTPTGVKTIESLRIGDLVWGRTREGIEATRVVGTTNHGTGELIEIEFTDGRTIRLTADHPIYSPSRRSWINAEDFREGDEVEALPRLLERHQEVSNGVRRLYVTYSSRERKTNEGQAKQSQRTPKVRGDSKTYEQVGFSASRRYGQTSKRAKVAGVQAEDGGVRTQRNLRLQKEQEREVRLPEGQRVFDEVRVGEVGSCLSGLEGMGLGLRAVRDSNSERGLSSRLSAQTERCTDRGQRSRNGELSKEDRGGSCDGLHDPSLGSEEIGEVRYLVIKAIRRIQGTVRVFDIQTETQNFYHNGVLVHNCYINSGFRGYRGTGLITVPINYGEQVADQLSKMRRAAAGYFSSFTDPFLPLESMYHNTQRAAEEFVKVGLPIFFLSRLRYPLWAINLLRKNPHSYAQKSINTCDPNDWRLLSPGALSLKEHMDDIRRLKRFGIYVSIQVNPVVAGITSNAQILKLFKMLKDAGADHVIVKFVEAGYSWAPTMVKRMKRRFGPERGALFESLFTENIGGQRTICEEYRMNAHRLYSQYAKKIGLTYATCYEYRYERDDAGKIVNQTGISIGREFTTADQCHGLRVPVYSRESADDLFSPVEECPPSGCLYCASENGGEPRCGDALAGEAKALRFVDLKIPFGRQR